MSATTDDVILLLTQVLTKHDQVSEDKLQEAVKERLKAAGKNVAGIRWRFKEAFADPRFVATDDGEFRLAEQPQLPLATAPPTSTGSDREEKSKGGYIFNRKKAG